MNSNSIIKTICRSRGGIEGSILQGGKLTEQSLIPLRSVLWFGTKMCPAFRRDSSSTSQPCCRSPRTPARCTGSRRCETSGTSTLPSTHNTVYTDGWTRSRQSRPPCTCFLKGKNTRRSGQHESKIQQTGFSKTRRFFLFDRVSSRKNIKCEVQNGTSNRKGNVYFQLKHIWPRTNQFETLSLSSCFITKAFPRRAFQANNHKNDQNGENKSSIRERWSRYALRQPNVKGNCSHWSSSQQIFSDMKLNCLNHKTNKLWVDRMKHRLSC